MSHKQSDELLRRAARLSRELMLVAGPDGTIEHANAAWKRVLGWGEAELRTMKFFDLVHPDDRERTRSEIGSTDLGAAVDFDNRCRHKDASYRWVSWSAASDGTAFYALGHDVTAERTAIDALRESQETVRRLQRMEALGQLAGGIGHEFNNLMQTVMSALQLVRMMIAGGRFAEAERFIASALDAAHGAALLNQRWLRFSRRHPQDPRPVTINELVAEMQEVLRDSLPHSIKLEVDLTPNAWKTRCDTDQAADALLNLILNARDAMPNGGTIAIKTRNVTVHGPAAGTAGIAAGQYACVEVTDSGPGMKPEVLRHAFDAFFTTKPAGSASGLGLTMVQRFARQNAGDATIESDMGRGTSVSLFLPRYQGAKTTANRCG